MHLNGSLTLHGKPLHMYLQLKPNWDAREPAHFFPIGHSPKSEGNVLEQQEAITRPVLQRKDSAAT